MQHAFSILQLQPKIQDAELSKMELVLNAQLNIILIIIKPVCKSTINADNGLTQEFAPHVMEDIHFQMELALSTLKIYKI